MTEARDNEKTVMEDEGETKRQKKDEEKSKKSEKSKNEQRREKKGGEKKEEKKDEKKSKKSKNYIKSKQSKRDKKDGDNKDEEKKNEEKKKDDDKKDDKEDDKKEGKLDGEVKVMNEESELFKFIINKVNAKKGLKPLTREEFNEFKTFQATGQTWYNRARDYLSKYDHKLMSSTRFSLEEMACLYYGCSYIVPKIFLDQLTENPIMCHLDQHGRIIYCCNNMTGKCLFSGKHRMIKNDKELDDDVFAMSKDGTLISSESLNNTKNSSSLSIFRHKTQQSDDNTFDMTFQPSIFSTPRTCHHVVYMGKDAYRVIFGAGYAKGNPMKVRCDHLKPMIEMIITLIKTSGVSKNSDTGLVLRDSVIRSIINWWEKLSDHTCTLKVSQGPCKNPTISNEELSCMIVFFEDYLNLNAE